MLKHRELTDQIINAFYKVYNTLAYGIPEKVYENALAIELRKRKLEVVSQAAVAVHYEGEEVGVFFAELLVQGLVILEPKAAGSVATAHTTQLINYLKASHLEVGLVLNFGPKPEFQRRVFDHRSGTGDIKDGF